MIQRQVANDLVSLRPIWRENALARVLAQMYRASGVGRPLARYRDVPPLAGSAVQRPIGDLVRYGSVPGTVWCDARPPSKLRE
jgi:hypothetical protein